MTYLVDSSVCIAILRDTSALASERFQRALTGQESILLSSVVLYELWHGVHNSARPAENAATLQKFLRGPLVVLPFDEDDARVAGEVRAVLQRSGRTIGAYDTMIAAQCLRRDITVVTANVSEFSRVKGLKWEDWTK